MNDIKINLNLTGEQSTVRGFKNAEDAAENFGDGLQKAARDAGFLDRRIGELKGGIRELTAELNRSGDKDLLKSIRVDQRELGQLEKLRKQLLDIGNEGGKSGEKLGEGLTKSLMALRGPAIGALVGLGVAAAPFLSGVIASAIIGGTGAGGIIGGVALAAQDARVQDEAAKLGEHLSVAFKRSAQPFVGPTIEALQLLRGVVDDVSGDMRQAFSTIAPVLVPLTKGISGFIDRMMPGIIDAMKSARPVLLVVANELPKIGASLGRFLSTLAEDPRGAIQAFQTLSKVIQVTIFATGELLAALSKIYATLGPALQFAQGDIAGAVVSIGSMQAALAEAEKMSEGTADSLSDLGKSASQAEQEIIQLTDAMDKAFGKTMDIQQATIGYEKSWDDTIEALREGKRTLDATTEAGRENRGAILDDIQAIKDLRQANIDNGMAVADANAIYDRQIEQLRQTALKLGFNKQQVNELINAFDSLPADIELELRVKGLRGVLEQMRALAALLGSNAAAARAASGDPSGYGGGRHTGGDMFPGQTYRVGEHGVEVVSMHAGGGATVYSAEQSAAMMSGASGGAQAATVVVAGTLRYVGPPGATADLAAALMTVFRVEIGAQGGNVQTVLGGG